MIGHVVSRDGTRIGFDRVGAGPALVIVHGGHGCAADWAPVAGLLGKQHSCFVIDRRGRGASGDGAEHSIGREAEDIAAVLAEAGPDAVLFGHSFGAVCALETMLRTPARRLIVYEPPLTSRSASVAAGFRALVDAGRADEALRRFLTDETGMPAAALASLETSPSWGRMLAIAPLFPREAAALAALGDPRRYTAITAPAIALVGERSPERLQAATRLLREIVPGLRVRCLAGQGHAAHRTAPALLAAAIVDALDCMGQDVR